MATAHEIQAEFKSRMRRMNIHSKKVRLEHCRHPNHEKYQHKSLTMYTHPLRFVFTLCYALCEQEMFN